MKTIEYLGTGPNPIHVPHLQTDGAISKGDRIEAQDDVAENLVDQGLFAFVVPTPPDHTDE